MFMQGEGEAGALTYRGRREHFTLRLIPKITRAIFRDCVGVGELSN